MKKLTKSQVIALVKKTGKLTIELYPSKCSPRNQTWVKGCELELQYINNDVRWINQIGENEPFDSFINSYSYYNCNSELGKRVHYYTKQDQ